MSGKASFVPLAAAGAVDEDVAFDDFFGNDGPAEGSPIRFLPILTQITDLDSGGCEDGRNWVNFALYNLKPQQWRFLGFRERKWDVGLEERGRKRRGGVEVDVRRERGSATAHGDQKRGRRRCCQGVGGEESVERKLRG